MSFVKLADAGLIELVDQRMNRQNHLTSMVKSAPANLEVETAANPGFFIFVKQ
jgi:hypothetical protein